MGYKPNSIVLEGLSNVDFVAVVGPTAVGKTTLIEEAMKQDARLHLVRVTTSRIPRPDEEDGKDYHFRTKSEMEKQIQAGAFVQVAPTVFGDLYATRPEDYSNNGLSLMAVIADAMPTFLALPFRRIRQIFILPPSWAVWQERLNTRQFTPEKLKARMKEAETSLEYALKTPDLVFVVNDNMAIAVKALNACLQDESNNKAEEGKELASKLLKHLKRQYLL